MASPSTADEVRSLGVLFGQMILVNMAVDKSLADIRSDAADARTDTATRLAAIETELAALKGHHAKPHWLTPFVEDHYVRRGILMVLLAMFCLSTGTCAAISLKDSGIMHSAIEATAPAIGVPHE